MWLVACSGDVSGTDENGADASARLACPHFRNIAGDAADGLITGPELREKIKEVEDNASVSEVPGLSESGRRLLRAVTQGDADEFIAAVDAFSEKCASVDL